MPELPEVETIKRDLEKKIRGKRIKDITTDNKKMFTPSFSLAREKITNHSIRDLERRGKLLIWKLDNGLYILIHLKMTGQLVYAIKNKLLVGGHPIEGEKKLPNKFTHTTFFFSDGSRLYFNDVRKFGYIKLVDQNGLKKVLEEFGLEPLSSEFTLVKFKEILRKYPNSKIKQLLMVQKHIAGIGNLYADESCFYARIKPIRPVKGLKEKEINDLYSGIKKILRLSVKNRGTSFNTYVDGEGRKGNFVKFLKVYGRAGEKCKRGDGGIIKRIRMGGRSAHYCPVCQK